MLSTISTADLLAELRRRRDEGLVSDPDAYLCYRLCQKACEETGIAKSILFSRRRVSARACEIRRTIWSALHRAGISKTAISRMFGRTPAAVIHGLKLPILPDLFLSLSHNPNPIPP